MLNLSVKTKPFSNKDECGDFYDFIEFDKYYLLIVGDIGGHGSPRVYTLANKIKELVKNHKDEPLKTLLEKIHSQNLLKNNGMAIFLAQIYKNMPLLNYCAIGNTKSFIYRNKNFIHLKSQNGILGYDIPKTIKTNLIKLLKNDILVVTTDGVSIHDSQMTPLLNYTKTPEEISEKIIKLYGKKEDDSLCLAIKFEVLKNKDFSIKYEEKEQVSNQEEKFIKNPLKKNTKKRSFLENQNLKKVKYETKNLKFLKQEHLLVKNLQKDLISFSVNKLDSLISFDKKDKIKIETFLTEILNSSAVDIYLNENTLQLFIKNIKKVESSLDFLFKNFYIFRDDSCIISINFNIHSNTNNINFNDLKHMLELGLNDEDYYKFKENEQNLEKMAKQAKLASMGEMIGNIAHQWRQPLSIISTIASGIELKKRYDTLDTNEISNDMETIVNQVNYLSRTIDDFKNFIKGSKEFLPISVKEVLQDTLSLVEASMKNNYITLITDIANDTTIDGNKNELEQAFINVINNSKDVLKEKKEEENRYIWVSTKNLAKGKFEVKILDNGGGIKPEIINRIFEPYFTTKHQSVGTGLGLSMTEKILRERYNASIEATNETFTYKNKEYTGACFVMTFPEDKQ